MPNPRAIIEVDGAGVKWTDIVDIRTENTLYLAADSFECSLNNEKFLSDWLRKNQEVKIYTGYVFDPQRWDKSELHHIFTGRIDGVKPNFKGPNIVKILGRDYSSPMIDTDCTIAFKDVTSSDVAHIFANKYKLIPKITATSTLIDKELLVDKKEWEILQMLGDLEGFVCYISKDKELYFGERQDKDEIIIDDFYYNLGAKSNCKIEFDDSSVGVINKVIVKHWVSRGKKLIEASSQNDFLIKQMGQVKERVFYISKATTVALAKQFADKKLKEYSRQVITGTGTRMPGNQKLYAECKIGVHGCGRFDGAYYLDRVVHHLDKQSGYVNEFDITSLRPENAHQYRQDLYSYKERKY